MSTPEISHETPQQEPQGCHICGAGYGRPVPEPGPIPSPSNCPACGAPLAPVAPAPPLPQKGRNPLALVVVALVVAAMLYFGMHMSRRPGTTAFNAKSSDAPDFTLESLD